MKRITFLLAAALAIALALEAGAEVKCSGTPCIDSAGGVTSPISVDPMSVTGVWTFDNAANTPVTLSDGAAGGTICSVGVADTANSVCVGSSAITGEGSSADASETILAFGNATADQTLTCTGAASSLGCVVASPAVPANGATAGNSLALTASPAIPNAGAGTDGAAAGGSITLTAGAAARDTSGNANGGDITLAPGAGIGTGSKGMVIIPELYSLHLGQAGTSGMSMLGSGTGIFEVKHNNTVRWGWYSDRFFLVNGAWLGFASGAYSTEDTGLARPAAGVLKITNASTGTGGLVATGIDRPEPTATTGASQAGLAIALTASDAVASTDTDGAAAGGAVTITSGAAARRTSGNANGGDINLVTGAGIGTGTAGQVLIPVGTAAKPGLAFTGETTDGIYALAGLDVVSIVSGGTATISANSGATQLRGPVTVMNSVPGGSGTGVLYHALSVETVATTKSPAVTESAELYTNGADVDGQAITLPNDPTVGVCYDFALTSTDSSGAFVIAPSAGETLSDAGTSCATVFSATAAGATCRICAVSGGSGAQWFVMSKNGTWTCTP